MIESLLSSCEPITHFFPFHSDEESAICISAYCLGLDYETERGEGNDTGFHF
jgi:hypothetical protein